MGIKNDMSIYARNDFSFPFGSTLPTLEGYSPPSGSAHLQWDFSRAVAKRRACRASRSDQVGSSHVRGIPTKNVFCVRFPFKTKQKWVS